MANLTFKMSLKNLDEIKRNLEKFGGAATRILASELYKEGERIIADAKDQTPVDTGNLRASGYVAVPKIKGKSVVVELGFGGAAAAYAVVVHENPRAGKTGGVSPQGKKYKHYAQVGKWKYLEDPFRAHEKGLTERIAAGMRARLRR